MNIEQLKHLTDSMVSLDNEARSIINDNFWSWIPNESSTIFTLNCPPQVTKCLHDSCPSCKGSGIKLNGGGICIHHIACNCPKHQVMC